MLTAVAVDSQMANRNRFGHQQVIPHSPFIASTLKRNLSSWPERETFQWPWLNHPKPVQSPSRDGRIDGSDQEKPVITKGILDKTVSRGQPKIHLQPTITIFFLKKSKCQQGNPSSTGKNNFLKK